MFATIKNGTALFWKLFAAGFVVAAAVVVSVGASVAGDTVVAGGLVVALSTSRRDVGSSTSVLTAISAICAEAAVGFKAEAAAA